MNRISLSEDVRPLSEFRAGVSRIIDQVRETKRPILITQHGKGVAVLMDVASYDLLMDRLDLTEEIQVAESELSDGRGIPHEEAKAAVLKGIRN